MDVNSVTRSDPAILELTVAVESLSRRVESLEIRRAAVEKRVLDDQTSQTIEAVRSGTETLFKHEVVMEQQVDPEIDERYVVVRVRIGGSPEDAAQPYREWHRRIAEWAPGRESQFRLAVDFADDT